MSCALFGICGGCDAWDLSTADKRIREENLLRVLSGYAGEIHHADTPAWEFRDKLDFSISHGRVGLAGLDSPEVVDVQRCPLLTPALQSWLTAFRATVPMTADKISVRLRVAPDGARGVWLRLGHESIKHWLEEGHWWEALRGLAHFEVGERLKPVLAQGKLAKRPALHPWFTTFTGAELVPTPLWGHVGSFTQTGSAPNRALVSAVRALLPASAGTAIELFAGLGNFTLPLASLGWQVEAYELRPHASLALRTSLAGHPWAKRVRFTTGNLYGEALPIISGYDLMLVDPPRSGLGATLLRGLAQGPATLIYVSCDTASFAADAVALTEHGYRLERLTGVDQFPHTRRTEWVGRFVR
jgi:23S rRNA (uracil1939-C5)-methyltransferase